MSQFARPDSDVTVSGWAPSTGTTLWGVLDETPASDTDYVFEAIATSTDTFEVGLSNISDPFSSTGHVVRARVQDDGGFAATWLVELYQGGSFIASFAAGNDTGAFETFTYTLSGAEADSITDYNNLRLRVSATTVFGGTYNCSWLELETPDAGTPPPDPQGSYGQFDPCLLIWCWF